MIISLDTSSDVPIYVQLRNQIVTGIGKGELCVGERLPSVRQMAADAGINTMTVNKTYQILKAEGFIEIDRRKGARILPVQQTEQRYREKLESELELLSAEACLKGMKKDEFLNICEQMFGRMQPVRGKHGLGFVLYIFRHGSSDRASLLVFLREIRRIQRRNGSWRPYPMELLFPS